MTHSCVVHVLGFAILTQGLLGVLVSLAGLFLLSQPPFLFHSSSQAGCVGLLVVQARSNDWRACSRQPPHGHGVAVQQLPMLVGHGC